MQKQNIPISRDYREYLIKSLRDPEDSDGYLTAILKEENPKSELLTSALDDVAMALGADSDRKWVKSFGTSDKSQSVYELAEWLNRPVGKQK